MISSEEFDVEAIKLFNEEEFLQLSYDEQLQELNRMQNITNKLRSIMKEKLEEKEEMNSAFLKAQKEYDACVANCKELSEREELINFIEDHATTDKRKIKKSDVISVESVQTECSLFPSGLETTQSEVITNIQRIGTAGNLQVRFLPSFSLVFPGFPSRDQRCCIH